MPPGDVSASLEAELVRLEAGGGTAAEALAAFDALPPAGLDDMIGRWRGGGLPTGHPFDGMLEALGWYGKDFVDTETVYPLLFRRGTKPPMAIDPALLPVGLLVRRPRLAGAAAARAAFRLTLPLLRTRQPGARLRLVAWRGKTGAAMIYDHHPICDHFRLVDADTRLGLMDLRGIDPFLFVLRRDSPAGQAGAQPP